VLLEAFERAADKDHNGVVSMSELTSYLAAHRCHGERRAEMHDGGLDALGREGGRTCWHASHPASTEQIVVRVPTKTSAFVAGMEPMRRIARAPLPRARSSRI
jgi:hypothetical protein